MSHYMTCLLCGYQATESNSREVGIVVKMLEHRTREHMRYQVVERRGYRVCWYYHTAESVGACPICGEEAAAWYADHHCSMCRTARVGADGVFVAWGFEFCRPCAARVAEAIRLSMGRAA